MSGINSVSSGSAVAELMKILEQNQSESLDLAKKLIKLANVEKVSQNEAEGKGQVLDLYA